MKHRNDPSWAGSLKSYPANGKTELSPCEELVDSTLFEWYAEKHRAPSRQEISLINSAAVPDCPHCHSGYFVKDGRRRDGVQKYLCNRCGSRFNPLTGTVLDSRKIPVSEWVEYLMHLFEFHSVTTSARDNRNAMTTGFYWLRKVFAVLDGCQDGVVLSGRVWIDEAYVSVDKGMRHATDGKRLRGISRDKIAICTATDGKSLYIVAEWASKPSKSRTYGLLKDRIAPGSTLVHDGDNSHSLLIKELGLESELHPTSETKGMRDADNPMDEVNAVHALLKAFLRSHASFKRRDLQGWLNLFWFIWSDPPSRAEKVAKFIEMAVSERKRIKYRDVYGKKLDK